MDISKNMSIEFIWDSFPSIIVNATPFYLQNIWIFNCSITIFKALSNIFSMLTVIAKLSQLSFKKWNDVIKARLLLVTLWNNPGRNSDYLIIWVWAWRKREEDGGRRCGEKERKEGVGRENGMKGGRKDRLIHSEECWEGRVNHIPWYSWAFLGSAQRWSLKVYLGSNCMFGYMHIKHFTFSVQNPFNSILM